MLDNTDFEFEHVPIEECENLCFALEVFGFCTIRHDGREPFTAQEVYFQAKVLDLDLLPIEAKMILDLSRHFVQEYAKYDEDANALNPYDPFAEEDDEEGDE